MANLLFPRLPFQAALSRYELIASWDISKLEGESRLEHEDAIFTQTGGRHITHDELKEICEGIRSLATESGYPEPLTRKEQAKFDAAASQWLYENLNIPIAEAIRKEVWSFLALVALPDIAKWRFPDFHQSRLLGGLRNVFQRMWLRAFLFDLGAEGASEERRWFLLEHLTEDAMVAIVERPSISANPLIARQIGLAWARTASQVGTRRMEAIHRDAMKFLRAQVPIVCLDMLPPSALRKSIENCYENAVASAVNERTA
jgi:hypothetical protein